MFGLCFLSSSTYCSSHYFVFNGNTFFISFSSVLIALPGCLVLLQGWEVTVIKQEETTEGPLEMQIALPSMPSLYIISFLYQACLEINRVGGHILDRVILHNFAWELLQKVC
jgi:hypothetical protein